MEGKEIRPRPNLEAERRSAGRPTKAQQEQLEEALLNVALDIFLERGFEQTSIEEIAAVAGMSKRTIYTRHMDKGALFKAAVRRAIEHYTVPRESLDLALRDTLEETLTAVARIRIENVATPASLKLQRILSAQSYRFPELAQVAFEEGAGPTIDFLAGLFKEHSATGEIQVKDPRRAASAFLSLVVGGPARLIIFGSAMSEKDVRSQISFAVALFLNGVRTRK